MIGINMDYLLQRVRALEARISRMEASSKIQKVSTTYNEVKAYAAISRRGTPGLLFGRCETWAFYTGDAKGLSEYAIASICDTPQEAINDIYRYGGTVYTFDTIREAMTFFLEHLKEGE